MSKQNTETLNKSIDALIDEIFVDETVEKSIDIAGDSKTKADEVANKAPKGQKDEARGAGRPQQISDVPQTDEDGKRAKDYDKDIKERDNVEEDSPEADQVKEMNQIKAKGGDDASKPKTAPFKKSNGEEISEEEYNEFLAFKKSQEDAKAEELKKAEENKQNDLIKSIVEKTVEKVKAGYEQKIEGLQKSLNEQTEMVKAMAEAPVRAKTITNIEALEKGQGEGTPQPETFSKSEMLDAAEELCKSGQLEVDHVVELDNNGYIYDQRARQVLESYLAKKG